MAINFRSNTIVKNLRIGPLSGGGGESGGGGGIPIDTTNLLIFLDASDSTSYSGTGTTWNDISGNNHHFQDSGGSSNFVSDGSASHFSWTNTGHQFDLANTSALESSITGYGPSYTFSQWIRKDSSTTNNSFVNLGFNFRIDRIEYNGGTVWNSGPENLALYYRHSDTKLFANTPPLSVNDTTNFSSYLGNWTNLTFTLTFPTPTTRRVVGYINGVEWKTNEGTWGYSQYRVTGLNSANLYIGNDGDIANFAFYNRELSASEVLANYNALSSRF